MPRSLATPHQPPGHLAHLRHRARRPGQRGSYSTCTESITHTSGRSASIVASTASRSVSATIGTASASRPETLGAQLHLRGRLLAGHVQHRAAGGGQVAERRAGERGLADPGRAADQHQRAGHEAAAEHAVELADAGVHPRDRRRLHLARAAPGVSARPPERAARRRRPPAPPRASPRRACSTRRSPGSDHATWGSRGRRRSRRRVWRTGPSSEAKARGGRLSPRSVAAPRSDPSARGGSIGSCGFARPAPRAAPSSWRSTPRPTGSAATSASSPRWAPCWSAAASSTRPSTRWCGWSARCRAGSSASPGSPRGWWTARPAGRGAARSSPSCSRAGCWWRTTRASTARVLRQAFERAGSTGPRRRRSARSRWPAASRRWPASAGSRRWPDSLGIEVDEVHRALPDARHLRARVLRPVPAAVRQRRDARRRARPARARAGAPARPSPREAIPRDRAPGPVDAARTTPASTCSATSAGGRSTWASRCPCARAPAPTSAPPRAGPSAPRSWTTGRPTPSSARSCSRTG